MVSLLLDMVKYKELNTIKLKILGEQLGDKMATFTFKDNKKRKSTENVVSKWFHPSPLHDCYD